MSNEITPIQAAKKPLPKNKFITGSDINAYRDSLVQEYRGSGHKSALNTIRNRKQGVTSDEILSLLIEEILQGNEQMLGTQLLLAQQGDLQMSTATIVRRSELLKAVADIIVKRKELNQRASDIDLNSPAFLLFQKLMFDKFMQTFEQLQMDPEMVSLIISTFQKKVKNWGKQLKQKLQEIAQ